MDSGHPGIRVNSDAFATSCPGRGPRPAAASSLEAGKCSPGAQDATAREKHILSRLPLAPRRPASARPLLGPLSPDDSKWATVNPCHRREESPLQLSRGLATSPTGAMGRDRQTRPPRHAPDGTGTPTPIRGPRGPKAGGPAANTRRSRTGPVTEADTTHAWAKANQAGGTPTSWAGRKTGLGRGIEGNTAHRPVEWVPPGKLAFSGQPRAHPRGSCATHAGQAGEQAPLRFDLVSDWGSLRKRDLQTPQRGTTLGHPSPIGRVAAQRYPPTTSGRVIQQKAPVHPDPPGSQHGSHRGASVPRYTLFST